MITKTRVPVEITKETTRMYRKEFSAELLRKRLGLPDDSELFHAGSEFDQPLQKLVVKYTRKS